MPGRLLFLLIEAVTRRKVPPRFEGMVHVIGMVLFCLLCYAVLLIYVPLGLLTPILLIFGSCGFMATYAAFPKIKAVMIDPYYTEPEEEEDDFEPVFRDMG